MNILLDIILLLCIVFNILVYIELKKQKESIEELKNVELTSTEEEEEDPDWDNIFQEKTDSEWAKNQL